MAKTKDRLVATLPKTKDRFVATREKKCLDAHEVVTSTTVQNAIAVQAWGRFAGEADLAKTIRALHEGIEKVQSGNMKPLESMLYGQAMTLQTIFTSLARRAAMNDGLKQFQVNLTLALKAQAQCRTTLQALAEIKHPRAVAFVNQANISNGPQQVNNGLQLTEQTGLAQGVESLPAPGHSNRTVLHPVTSLKQLS